MPRSLADVARNNAQRHQLDASHACSADPSGRVHAFRQAMAGTAMGSCVDVDKLRLLDQVGEVLCARELVRRSLVAAGQPHDAAAVEAAFHASQIDASGTDWYAGRASFEDHWSYGRAFVYWSVVADGPGLAALPDKRFGDYCLAVLDPHDPTPDALGVFPGNSASRYVTGAGLDSLTCEDEAARWEERADLLTVKHEAELRGHTRPWGELICRTDDWAEVVRAGRLPLSSIAEVRIVASWLRALQDLATRPTTSLGPLDQVNLEAYQLLRGWHRRLGLRIVSA